MAEPWKPRDRRVQPQVVRHGLAEPFEGTWDEAVRAAASVSLVTFGGAWLIVGELTESAAGTWRGTVLQNGGNHAAPPIGSIAEFTLAQVQSATLSTSATVSVLVPLLDEGTEVWRPVPAQKVGEHHYRISAAAQIPPDEKWAFLPGSLVTCELRTFADGSSGLVAVRDVT